MARLSHRRTLRILRLVFVVVALGGTAYFGLMDALDSFTAADTFLRKLAVTSQLLYAICGGLAILAVLQLRSDARWLLFGWAGAATLTAFLAPIAWGGTGVATAAVAGASAALLTAVVVWAGVRASQR